MSRPRRFDDGVTSLPLWLRLALTVPVVLIEFVLLRSVVLIALEDEDPRPAAFVLFLAGVIAFIAAPVLRETWRSTLEWRWNRVREAGAGRLTADQLRDRSGLAHFAAYDGGAAGRFADTATRPDDPNR